MAENLTNEEDQHRRNVISLIEDYGNKLQPSTIEQTYQEICSRFEHARIRVYVPLLAMRHTKEVLMRI
jgi:hypothetical protein